MRIRPSLYAAIALAVAPLAAQSLTGHFQTAVGVPVANVGVILSNGAPTGTSDINGNFLISGLRDRTYTVQINPHNDFLLAQQFDFSVAGAASLGTRVLQPALPVSARFVGPTGAALLGVNLNAYQLDGLKLYTPNDGTDALGNASISLPVNVPMRVRAVPPVGSGLVPFEQIVTATSAVSLGTITLRQGFAVTGSAVDQQNSLPVSGCEITTTNMLTGENVVQLNKLTNALGGFSLLLPFGVFEVQIVPPLGNLHAAKQLLGVLVFNVGSNLGLVPLERAFNLIGQVRSTAGLPVAGADVDVYTHDGYKLFTPNDNTNATGNFSVYVPAGTYRVRVDPPVALGLVGVRSAPFTVPTTFSVGLLTLAPGVAMHVDVFDASFQPVAGANIDFRNPATGEEVILAGDVADAFGRVRGVAPIGIWDVSISAPQGSSAAALRFLGVPIVGPVNTALLLPKKNLRMDLSITQAPGAIPSLPPGGLLPVMWTVQNLDTISHHVFVDAAVVLPSGTEVPMVPLIAITMPGSLQGTMFFHVPMPVLPATERGRIQKFVVRLRNPDGLQIVEQANVEYVAL